MLMAVESIPFGTTSSGQAVTAYKLQNRCGTHAVVLDYGATLQSLVFDGIELVHGYETVRGYEEGKAYFGATIGRTCNRIAGAAFELNGSHYQLFPNDGRNQNHGGKIGFSHRMWQQVPTDSPGLLLRRISPDGEEGYPGTVVATVQFLLNDENQLHIHYSATTDRDTPLCMTNHSYFNLSKTDSALGHILHCPAEFFVENTAESIPTGYLASVCNTPFDFRTPKSIGRDIDLPTEQLRQASGYDHTLVATKATLSSPDTGITLHISTDLPGIHLYTANYTHEFGRKKYTPRSAVCLEPQLFADSIHHPAFPSAVLKAGKQWHSETIYSFSRMESIL